MIDSKSREEQQKKRSFYEQLDVHLDGSGAAFRNQVRLRGRLVDLLEERLGDLPDLEYEPLFRQLYKDFTDEERFLCDTMRGITAESLYRHNASVRELLEGNPQYKDDIKSYSAMQEHLDFWIGKYRGVESRQDWCLVYTGVEDEKPFPPRVVDEVKEILRELNKDSLH